MLKTTNTHSLHFLYFTDGTMSTQDGPRPQGRPVPTSPLHLLARLQRNSGGTPRSSEPFCRRTPRTQGWVACVGCRQGLGALSVTGCYQEPPATCSSCNFFPQIHARWSLGPVSRARSCQSGPLARTAMVWPFQGRDFAPLRNVATAGPFARQVLPSAGAAGNILTKCLMAIGEGTKGHLPQPLI